MTRSTAITRTRGRRSAPAYRSRSTTAAEDNLNRLGTPRAGTLLTTAVKFYELRDNVPPCLTHPRRQRRSSGSWVVSC